MKKRLLFLIGMWATMLTVNAQLQAPQLLAPADSAQNVISSANFNWRPSLGGTVSGYELQIDTDANFTNPVFTMVNGTTGSTGELMFGTRYYWRVRGMGPSGNSEWSDTLTFTTYTNAIALTSPMSGDTIDDVQENLVWTKNDSVNYQLQLDTTLSYNSPSFQQLTIIVPSSPSTTVSSEADNLLFDARYYWRVRAIHSADTSDWTVSSNFTTAPTLILRDIADGATGISPDTNLRTRTMNGVAEYEFEIDSSASINPASKQYHTGILSDVNFGVSELLFGQTYYWRARGRNINGISEWAPAWSFTVAATVAQTAPDDNGDVGFQPTLEWDDLFGVTLYEIELDDNPGFSSPELFTALGSASSQVLDPLDLGTYYWRIRAMHASDTSDWSAARSFNVTPVGISEKSEGDELSIYPNPSSREINIILEELKGTFFTIEVLDLTGRLMYSEEVNLPSSNKRHLINVRDIPTGAYIMRVVGSQEQVAKKISIFR